MKNWIIKIANFILNLRGFPVASLLFNLGGCKLYVFMHRFTGKMGGTVFVKSYGVVRILTAFGKKSRQEKIFTGNIKSNYR